MKYVFKTPDLGEGTTQAEIVEWRVSVGDLVREDQPIVDLMTDKATVEISSPVHGTIVAQRGAPGRLRITVRRGERRGRGADRHVGNRIAGSADRTIDDTTRERISETLERCIGPLDA